MMDSNTLNDDQLIAQILKDDLGDTDQVTEEEEVVEEASDDESVDDEATTEESEEEPTEEESDEEEEDGNALDLETELEVRVDGEMQTVKLKDLVQNYNAQFNYTRSKQELANEKKAFEADKANYESVAKAEALKVYEGTLQQVIDFGNNIDPVLAQAAQMGEAGWNKLLQENPNQYVQLSELVKRRQAAYGQMMQEVARVRKEKEEAEQATQFEQIKTFVEDQKTQLINKIPEWKNKAYRESQLKKIVDIGSKKYGFTQEEIESVVDHRYMLVILDAINAVETKQAASQLKERVFLKPKSSNTLKPGQSKPKGKNISADDIVRNQSKLGKDAALDALVSKLF